MCFLRQLWLVRVDVTTHNWKRIFRDQTSCYVRLTQRQPAVDRTWENRDPPKIKNNRVKEPPKRGKQETKAHSFGTFLLSLIAVQEWKNLPNVVSPRTSVFWKRNALGKGENRTRSDKTVRCTLCPYSIAMTPGGRFHNCSGSPWKVFAQNWSVRPCLQHDWCTDLR